MTFRRTTATLLLFVLVAVSCLASTTDPAQPTSTTIAGDYNQRPLPTFPKPSLEVPKPEAPLITTPLVAVEPVEIAPSFTG